MPASANRAKTTSQSPPSAGSIGPISPWSANALADDHHPLESRVRAVGI
jgi:hypothetical protein